MKKEELELLSNLVPRNYKKLTHEQRKKYVSELETYVSNIQGRTALEIEFINDPDAAAEYHVGTEKIYINDDILDNPLSVFSALLHEGYHHMQFNMDLYPNKFSDIQKEMYNLNSYNSLVDDSLINYSASSYNDLGYFLQPLEFFAYDESLRKGSEILKKLENELKVKNLVKMYEKDEELWSTVVSNIGYDKITREFHPKLIEKYKEIAERDQKNAIKVRVKIDKILSVQDNLKDIEPQELAYFFMPQCWNELSAIKKQEVYKEFIKKNKLGFDKTQKIDLAKSGIKVLSDIYTIHTNEVLKKKTNKNIDFLKTFDDSSLNLIYELNLNREYKKHKNKDVESFYSFEELQGSFFLFPKFGFVRESLFESQLRTLEQINEYFFKKDNIKHDELDRNVMFLKMSLFEMRTLFDKQMKFEKKFNQKRIQ